MGKLIVVCLAIAIIFLVMLASRSQALQRFAALELALVLAVSASAYVGCVRSEEFIQREYLDMYGLYAERLSAYLQRLEETNATPEKDTFMSLLDQAFPVTTKDGESYSCLGAAVVRRTNAGGAYSRLVSVGRHEAVYEAYQSQAQRLLAESLKNQKACSAVTEEGTGLLAVVDTEQIAPSYGIVVEIPLSLLEGRVAGQRADMVRVSALLLAAGTALLALIIYFQGRETRSAVRLMTKMVEGREPWEAGMVKKGLFGESNEVRALRNSLTQLINNNQRADYMKYQMLQAYYRFAPKQIERLLDKPSILDVEIPGEVQMKGTMAVVSVAMSERFSQQEMVRRLNDNYRQIVQAAKDGMFLCGNADLSSLSFLFPDAVRQAISFGIDVMTCKEAERAREQSFVLLHHANVVYGVVGDDRQASVYVLSPEMKALGSCCDKLRALGVRMAVTDSVYELAGEELAARYIGFAEKGRYSFKLYEVLDAYPAKERQIRLDTKQKFQEALNLFYQDDFYLARSLFTEVLKENPTDEVAKWYVFLCEKCLDSGTAGGISYGIFAEE